MMNVIDFLIKVILGTCLGAVIGSEREISLKQRTMGLRTFALLSLFGSLTVTFYLMSLPLSEFYPIIGFVFVFVYTYVSYMSVKMKYGLSTLICIPFAYLIGVLVGFDQYSIATSLTFVISAVLLIGEYLHRYIESLKKEEINEMIQFALILFVIFPLLPDNPITWSGLTFDLKLFFEIILLISLFNLFAFLCERFFRKKDAIAAGFLYGIINSTIATYYFAKMVKKDYEKGALSAILGSTVRNFIITIALLHYAFSQILLAFFLIVIILLGIILIVGKRGSHAKLPIYTPFNISNGIAAAFAIFSASLLMQILSVNFEFFVPLASFLGSMISSALIIASLSTVSLSAATIEHSIILAIAGSLITNAITVTIKNPEFAKSYYAKIALLILVCAIFYVLV
jgi:uncharacterized membrane protein (DUF4010 family)